MSNPINTTTTRATGRAFVAAIVGALIAWGTTKWGKLNTGTFAALTPVVSGVYYTAISTIEKKYPKFGWLLGTLPQPKAPQVLPSSEPMPVKKATAKKVQAVKKATPKKK
jgi:hypothetical protein